VDVSAYELVLLFVAATFAGTVDAIAGGGGLITLPALLATGLPPASALATNKGQSVFGSATAFWRFRSAGLIEPRLARATFGVGLLGSFLGAALLLVVDQRILRPLVIVLLFGVSLFFAFRRGPSTRPEGPPLLDPRALARGTLAAFVIGAYDGFFGPGTGTFLIVAFMTLLNMGSTVASANAKVVNFASNLAAVVLFGVRGLVLWKVALPMAAGQFLGGILGSRLAIWGGNRFVSRVVLFVSLALVLKLAYDLYLAR
jgi:uncharacterized membrane protein YfcA